MQKICLAVVVLFYSLLTFAQNESTLVKVTSDSFKGTASIDISQEANGSASWIVYTGFDSSVVKFTPDELKGNFKVLASINGTDVTYLGLDSKFDSTKGGAGYLKFLYSGAGKNTYKNFRFEIVISENSIVIKSAPDPNDPLSDNNSFVGPFNSMHLFKNTLLGRTVGIKKIEPSLN